VLAAGEVDGYAEDDDCENDLETGFFVSWCHGELEERKQREKEDLTWKPRRTAGMSCIVTR
jgi:hypothetical protein